MYSASPCTVRVYIPPDCCVLAQGPKGLKNERNRNTTSAGSSRTFNHTRLLEVISRTSTLASAFPSCISRPPWLARCLAPALLAFALLPPLRRYFDVSHKRTSGEGRSRPPGALPAYGHHHRCFSNSWANGSTFSLLLLRCQMP